MFSYKSTKQLSIFDFRTPFEQKLSPNNRWVKLAQLLDWDALVAVYARSMSSDQGAPGIDARIVLGALIIKHMENKDDRGTIEAIQENPYMQYFVGLDGFTTERVFDPSLFVYIRKRLSSGLLDEMNQMIMSAALQLDEQKTALEKQGRKQKRDDKDNTGTNDSSGSVSTAAETGSSDEPPNKGKLQMDATVADAYIQYPTDLNLLNESREKSEVLIDVLYTQLPIKVKPRTYRRVARKAYLNIAKKKNKSRKTIRRGIKAQLGYLRRNLNTIDKIVEQYPFALGLLDKAQYRYLLVIRKVYDQQLEMYTEQKHQVDHRIVSIHQPHIRPMVRGKEKHKVEFGPKINVSLQNGFARIHDIEFEAYNESTRLIAQVEAYRKLNGCYPELVQTDKIYLTRANRAYLKEHHIRHTGKPLGRAPKEALPPYQKRKQRKEQNERNQIEGKFGQGKRAYGLNRIMAKLHETQASWVASILFVMNILKWSKDIFVRILNALLNIKFHDRNQGPSERPSPSTSFNLILN